MTSIIGRSVYVSFPKLGIGETLAKIDTGAYSGAINCSNISLKDNPSGQTLVFKVLGEKGKAHEASNFRQISLRTSNGQQFKRFVIDTEICLDGKLYSITTGLSDRSLLRTPILIGRKFLNQNNIIVDVTKAEYFKSGE